MQQTTSQHWPQTDVSGPHAQVLRAERVAAEHVQALNKADVKSLFEPLHIGSETAEQSESAPKARVEEALYLFDQLSTQLTSSYRHLEQEVEHLKHELSEEEAQRQEQLKEREALATRMSTLLEILPAGVVLLDGQGRVSECNPAAVELLGEPLEGELWLDIIKRSFAPKRDDGHEVSLRDGRRVRIETRSMSAEPGQLILLSDLTETRVLQEQVARAERLSSLGRMVASLAHQIRTPLSTAMLYAGHLAKANIAEDMRQECADKLLSRLTHLEHQIRDMLIFAKGETRMAEELGVDEFEDALHQALEPLVDGEDISMDWDCKSSSQRLLCNREALVGACVNLVNNSIEAYEQKHRTRKGLHLAISIEECGKQGINICLRDNGPGIPKIAQKKLFEPFYTTKAQGTGLGLAVVQAVVKAHKGLFTLDSGAEGVTCVMTLPTIPVKSAYLKRARQ